MSRKTSSFPIWFVIDKLELDHNKKMYNSNNSMWIFWKLYGLSFLRTEIWSFCFDVGKQWGKSSGCLWGVSKRPVYVIGYIIYNIGYRSLLQRQQEVVEESSMGKWHDQNWTVTSFWIMATEVCVEWGGSSNGSKPSTTTAPKIVWTTASCGIFPFRDCLWEEKGGCFILYLYPLKPQ